MSSPKIHAILANLPLFKEMTPEEIDGIVQNTRELRASRGEMVFQRVALAVGRGGML